MTKYVHKKGEIIHCPLCRGVILRDFQCDDKNKETIFVIRCPHCSCDVHVEVQASGEIFIEKKPEHTP